MKNRLLLILVLLLSLTITTKARPVNMQTAREVAMKFANANSNASLRSTDDLQLVTTYHIGRGDAAFYVFNTPNGFVIVAADDCSTPILGYSDEGQFDMENIPIQMQEYLQDFVEQIQYGIENHLEADEATARQWNLVQSIGHLIEQRATTAVEPLLTDTWNQSCYYNSKCPVDSDGPCGHAYAGCAATSFAQILHYWGYPSNGIGSHTYTPTGYPQQTANFGATTYDWANMPNRLSAASTSTQIDAVATLMWHCGVAVEMKYGPDGSGASESDVVTALVDYFGYSDELTMESKSQYNNTEWLALLKNCLDLGRPIHYCGNGGLGTSGHAFVCDGYNSNNLLHFNWGWGGKANGYFSIGTLNPSGHNYNSFNRAIINIHPTCALGTSYQMTVTANPSDGGTVSGTGTYNCGESFTLTATPAEGFVFNNWTKNGEVFSYFSTLDLLVSEAAEYVAHFQQMDGIVIGEATSTDSHLPTYSKYSLSQQIYTAEEMGGEACEISSVSFFNTGSSKSRNFTIYMANTNKTKFNSSTDWIPVSEVNKVFSGSVTMAAKDWTTIYFNTPFNYDGLSNIALVVDNNSNSSGSISCRTFSTVEKQAIYIYGSDINYDPYNTSVYSGTRMSTKNQVVFGIPSYDYNVTVTTNSEEGGTVNGGGPCYLNQHITLTAIPYEGYVFNSWTKDGVIVSYLSSYNLTVAENAEFVANFQQVDGIVIGDAVSTNSALPTNSNYSLSQQIYTSDEVGGEACEISSVSFFNTGNAKTRSFNIYMVNTEKVSFESTTDWIPVTEADQVFSGNVTIASKGWTTIYFNTPFSYDGQSNVALIVDDNSNTTNNATLGCRTFSTVENQAIRINGSSTNYDPYNPSSYTGTLMSVKNQVIFGLPSYDYNVTVTTNSEEGGTVNGGGPCYLNQPITLTAIPNEGYVFNSWTKDGIIVSCLSIYSFPVTETAEYMANFQQTDGIVIGEAVSTNSYLPTNSNYSLSQQIYTSDEMGDEACEISSVSFFNTESAKTRSFNVYMVNTEKTSFDSTTDWIPVTEANQVFSGSVTMASKGWTTICFNTPFLYDGSSNVALIVDDNSNSYNYSNISCRTFDTESTQALRVCSTNTNYDPYNPEDYAGTLMSIKNQVIFGFPRVITATANPFIGGTVYGVGSYNLGVTCTLTAMPNTGYYFVNWTEDGSVVSYDASYSFIISGDRNLVANFAEGESSCVICFDLYDSKSNGWSGNYLVIDYGDGTSEQLTLESGSSASYSREVATGSSIALSWIVGTNTSQCSFDIRFENNVPIYHGSNLSANFQHDITVNCAVADAPRVISAVAAPEDGGIVSGLGTYESGSVITLTASPNEGYTFMYWEENGVVVSSNAEYTFLVSSDRNMVAHFSLPLTISVTTNLTAGGTITGADIYDYGTTCTLTATPNEGYLFQNWSKDGEVISCNATYSFTVTEDTEIEAVFMFLLGKFIGTGEETNSYLPSFSNHKYTLSQQIYTADEIGEAGNITSISYFNASESKTRYYDIYMVHTDKSVFNNNSDWIMVSEANHVYSGSVTMTKGYWNTITLNTPFAYDGTSNLAIIIDDNTGSGSSGMACRVFDANSNQAIRICSRTINYDPYNPSEYQGTRYSVKNQIILSFEQMVMEQIITLSEGWNWWSTNLIITLDELKGAIADALGTNGSATIKSQDGAITYRNGQWRGTAVQSLDTKQLYEIQTSVSCEITVAGMPANPVDYEITIHNGNNWIGYLPNVSMTLDQAFGTFPVNGDIIKSKDNSAAYHNGQWRGLLTNLQPGKGYIYKSNTSEDRTFVFPSGR